MSGERDELAAKDAEIARLRAALREIEGIVTALTGPGAFPMKPELAYDHILFTVRAALGAIAPPRQSAQADGAGGRCQHDLLASKTTIKVDDPHHCHCTVCGISYVVTNAGDAKP